MALTLIWSEVQRRTVTEGSPNWQILWAAGEIAALANWLDYSQAMPSWRRYWKATEPVTTPQGQYQRVALSAVVGAAALQAGVASVAIEVVLSLREANYDVKATLANLDREEIAERFKQWSDLFGGYLGFKPLDAVPEFIRFASAVAAAEPSMTS